MLRDCVARLQRVFSASLARAGLAPARGQAGRGANRDGAGAHRAAPRAGSTVSAEDASWRLPQG